MTKTVAICTLGCKVNAYESEAVKEQFIKNGYSVVEFGTSADIYIVNTCTVTHLSDRKSRQMIRRAKHKNPDAVLVVMGCFSQTAPEKVREIEGVDIIIGNEGKGAVLQKVEALFKEKAQKLSCFIFSASFSSLNCTTACRFESAGRMQQLLFLLHHSLCARKKPFKPDGKLLEGCK